MEKEVKQPKESYITILGGLTWSDLLITDSQMTLAKRGNNVGQESSAYLLRVLLLKGYTRTEAVTILVALGREVDYAYASTEWRLIISGLSQHIRIDEKLKVLVRGRKTKDSPSRSAILDLKRCGLLEEDIIITENLKLKKSEALKLGRQEATQVMLKYK